MVTIYDIQNKFVGRFKSNLHFTVFVYGFSSIHSRKRASCNNCVDNLQQTGYQQADIRMHSYGLRQLVDDKSLASCQQICYKLIVKTCYPQACCKLFQQVVTSLPVSSCNKPDFEQTVLLQLDEIDKLQKAGKTDNLRQVCGVLGCVMCI